MSLKERLAELIRTEGPIPLSTFMQIALHDPASGYYATRPGLGRDFTTAPEISQIFGELIGLWIVHEWRALGAPDSFSLVEIGPGSGQLMADALRLAEIAGGAPFRAAAHLRLIEASPALRQVQADRLCDWSPEFANRLSEIPDGPMLLIANEYLDCLPVRQFHRDELGWRECVVGLTAENELTFGLSAGPVRLAISDQPDADSIEIQFGLDLLVAELSARSAPQRSLFIDYGPDGHMPGDTLRAFRAGAQVSPLENPGQDDLTADVDFRRLGDLAKAAGMDVAGPLAQGLFLLGLGAQARLDQLIRAMPEQAEAIFTSARRLIDPSDMGEKFKAICLSSAGLAKPAGF